MSSKHIAAIFLAKPQRAAELAEALGPHGIESVLAESSDEFYRLLNHQRVDLVVIDNDLRGFLSGLEILDRLYNDLLRPATVLVGQLSSDEQERARGLGIDQVLRSNAEIETVRSAAAGLLATVQHAQVVVSPAARKLVLQSDTIRPLPQLLVKMCGYLDHQAVSMSDLARDISVDPRVTAELLKLTNSTAMGLRRKVTKVFDAVNFLGVRRTVMMVLSANVIDAQSRLARSLPAEFRTWYNTRSVLMASTASAFAGKLGEVSHETAYILGLLQDIGVLVLAQNYGERYLQMLGRVRTIGSLRLEVTERDDYGVTHAEVSAALLQKWALPSSLTAMVLNHHNSGPGERSQTEQRFLHVMQIGEAVANLLDKPSPQRHQALNRLLTANGAQQSEACKLALAEAVAKTAESSQLFSIPVPDETALRELLHKAADPSPEPSSEPDEEGDAAPRRALVIEDEAAVIRLVQKILTPLGWDVVSCGDWDEAVRLAAGVELVLCDVHLSRESGIEIVSGLRQDGFDGPVIMISGDRSRETVTGCVKAGITDFLIKPFNRETLLQKLARHIELSQEAAAALESSL